MEESKYIKRCIDLAKRGAGYTLSNPLVGCVIVYGDAIVGEGWHKNFGGPHAEVNALNAVEDKTLLPQSTLYVNLEPCAHHGKTPPCADLIIGQNITRVIIGSIDPNPLVSGAGIAKLRNSGIEVITGVEADACKQLNAVFFTLLKHKRPYIILKWAQTQDGYMSKEDNGREQISNPISQILTHKLRAATHATMVGFNTVLHDNPRLNLRFANGESPVRVVVDRELNLHPDRIVFTDSTQPTWIMNTIKSGSKGHIKYIKCADIHFTQEVIQQLYNHNIASVLVEGGPATLTELINHNLWDEAWVYTSPAIWGGGKLAPAMRVKNVHGYPLNDNLFTVYRNPCYTL